jgi:hypothetical protein
MAILTPEQEAMEGTEGLNKAPDGWIIAPPIGNFHSPDVFEDGGIFDVPGVDAVVGQSYVRLAEFVANGVQNLEGIQANLNETMLAGEEYVWTYSLAGDGVLVASDQVGNVLFTQAATSPGFTSFTSNFIPSVDVTSVIFRIGNLPGTTRIYIDGVSAAMVCFAHNTFIKTIDGERFVEGLSVGDLVFTQDNGYQPIRWIGNRRLSRTQLETNPKLKPIRIQAGALGHGLPEQDLLVSPQHRILLRNKVAINMFGVSELLVPAIKLIALPGVDILEDCAGVEYYHMLFDRHEIIFANGSPTESLFTGSEALKAVGPEAREEIAALFPEILDPDFEPTSARFIPEKGKDMKKLAMRLAKNTQHAPYEQAGQ